MRNPRSMMRTAESCYSLERDPATVVDFVTGLIPARRDDVSQIGHVRKKPESHRLSLIVLYEGEGVEDQFAETRCGHLHRGLAPPERLAGHNRSAHQNAIGTRRALRPASATVGQFEAFDSGAHE